MYNFKRKIVKHGLKGWRIEISENASKVKKLDDFIKHIQAKGLSPNEIYFNEDYKLMVRITNIDKLVDIYTIQEWNNYDKYEKIMY